MSTARPNTHRTTPRLALALSFAIALMVSTTAFVSHSSMSARHLKLLRSFPTADTTLTQSPTAIRLWFTEPAELPASQITLASAAGTAVKLGALTRAQDKDAPLTAAISSPLPSGAYIVTWKAMSNDGHVVNGTFGFSLSSAK